MAIHELFTNKMSTYSRLVDEKRNFKGCNTEVRLVGADGSRVAVSFISEHKPRSAAVHRVDQTHVLVTWPRVYLGNSSGYILVGKETLFTWNRRLALLFIIEADILRSDYYFIYCGYVVVTSSKSFSCSIQVANYI